MKPAAQQLVSDPTIRRILIVKWSALGDLVISTAIMEDIRRAFPEAELHLNTLPPWDRLIFASDDRFASVFTVDLRGREKGIGGIWKWFRMVNSGGYDAIFDLQSNDRTRLLITLLRLFGRPVKYLVGNHARFPYTVAPGPHPPFTHALVRQQRTLEACGIPTTIVRPTLAIPRRNRERAVQLQADHGIQGGGYVIFMPGSSKAGGPLKRWGTERFIRLGEILRQEGIGPVVIIGGGDEEEECRAIRDALGPDGAVNLCGQTEVLDIIPLCADARFIVANDSGTAHLASFTDRPMVVICGPTDPRRVKPLGGNVVTLQADLECINCYRKECDTHACMAMITPEMVQLRLAELCGDSAGEREGDRD